MLRQETEDPSQQGWQVNLRLLRDCHIYTTTSCDSQWHP